MAKLISPLSDRQVVSAKAKARMYRLFDGGGLYLEVSVNGSKLWKFKYRRPDKRETRISFGAYPDVTLADARERRAAARRLLAQDVDPAEAREAERRVKLGVATQSFETVARDWHARMSSQWQPNYGRNIMHRLEMDIFPWIGKSEITELTTVDILAALRRIEGRGAKEVARRNAGNVSRICDYAVHTGILKTNPAGTVVKALEPRVKGHFAAIKSSEIPAFYKELVRNNACMGPVVRIAMHLMFMVFVRTAELIETPWSEIPLDDDEAPWIIPWQRMKRGRRRVNPCTVDHHVMLPRQARVLLRELHSHTGGGRLLFPNQRNPDKPMSNNTLLKALERMGYKGDMTGHGFRALAMSTLKEQLHYRHEVVDRQLAHAQEKLDSAYDRAHYMAERKQMLQAWADYIYGFGL